jgi:amino acid transporter
MPGLILAATLGGTITMTLGYSRILHAAGAEGNLFRIFGRVHPVGHFPTVSLLAISAVAVALCWFSLERLVSALMIIHMVFQFVPQVLAIFAMRMLCKEIRRPYRMWLYPVPAVVAQLGWIYVAATPDQRQYLGFAPPSFYYISGWSPTLCGSRSSKRGRWEGNLILPRRQAREPHDSLQGWNPQTPFDFPTSKRLAGFR